MRPIGSMRQADEFETALEGGPSTPAYDALLALVADLRAVPEVEARPEFTASLRTQLVAAAQREPARVESELAAKLTPRQRKGSRERRMAALIGGFAVVSATGSVAVAAQSTVPGDLLYPMKRAIENAQTNLQSDPASRAETVLTHAESRLDETQKLVGRDADADAVTSALQDFVDQAEQGSELTLDSYAASGDQTEVVELRKFASASMDLLAGLGDSLPDEARAMLITATQTVRQIDMAAWEACPSCGGAITELPDLTALPLQPLLNGEVPETASMSFPLLPEQRAAKPDAEKEPKESATEDAGTDDATEPPVTEKPETDPVKKTIDKTKESVDKITGGSGTTKTDGSEQGLTDRVVDGITTILGGLLR